MENVELEKLVNDEDEYNQSNDRDSGCEVSEGYEVDLSKFKK